MPGPLAGIRVVEATTSWSGPMCGCVLADMGADVVKVELADGELSRKVPPFLPGTEPPLSFMHATVNRNKRSLCLDLRSDAGRQVFFELARPSDVVVENFTPGTMDSWGLGYRDVRAAKEDIIYCSISGFGQWGPDHERVAYDPLIQATSGFMAMNGELGGAPVKAPTYLSDDISGLHGAIGVLRGAHPRGIGRARILSRADRGAEGRRRDLRTEGRPRGREPGSRPPQAALWLNHGTARSRGHAFPGTLGRPPAARRFPRTRG